MAANAGRLCKANHHNCALGSYSKPIRKLLALKLSAPHPLQRRAREGIGQAAKREVSCQVRQMKTFAHVSDFFAHLRGVANQHGFCATKSANVSLRILGAVLVVGAIGFRLGDTLGQIACLSHRSGTDLRLSYRPEGYRTLQTLPKWRLLELSDS